MAHLIALLLLTLAASPALAQTGNVPRPAATDTVRSIGGDPVAVGDTYRVPTPLEAVTGLWYEAFNELEVVARTLGEYPEAPVGQQAAARTSVALHAASVAGGLIESVRFSVTFAGSEAAREANIAVLEKGY